MEVAGAALGLAAVDLAGVLQRFAGVGDEDEVDGQGLPAAAEGLGEVALQGPVEAALQLGAVGEGGHQGGVQGGVGRGIAEGGTGGGAGDDPCGGIEEDGKEVQGGTAGPVIAAAQVALTELGGVVVNVAGGAGILVLAHGSLLGWLGHHKPFYGGSLRPLPPLAAGPGRTANY